MKRSFIALGITVTMVLTACAERVANENDDMIAYESIEKSEEITQEITQEIIDDIIIETEETQEKEESGIDVDLTILSSTMVYAEVYNMYMNSEDYIGKSVKVEGAFSVVDLTMAGKMYFSVVVEDALGCCAQGIEFELEGENSYPDDYPEVGEMITVVGEFQTYYEGESIYCRLTKASVVTINQESTIRPVD